MSTATRDPVAMNDSELLVAIRQYISLRKELCERGDRISEALNGRDPRTIVVASDDGYFEVYRNSLPSGCELPVSVRPVRVLT